uniref:Exostosin GT47 domain-containing protein n=1 Tax=Fagus sylvatica TaxID=28930 RepID=A0A2N9ELL3_FAGSY
MKQYKCLTNDSSLASAIYVPFYPGFAVSRYLWGFNISVRDAVSLDLVKWLAQRPEWKRMWGRDHFLVGGRIAWDFRRLTDNDTAWGSKLIPRSAYEQYLWHLPKNYTKYSVFIPQDDFKNKKIVISERLLRIPKKEVLAMREEVIKLIPRIVYADPRYRLENFEDAFDIAVKGVLEIVEAIRRDIKEGKDLTIGFEELNGIVL